jgi:hypothetical protein
LLPQLLNNDKRRANPIAPITSIGRMGEEAAANDDANIMLVAAKPAVVAAVAPNFSMARAVIAAAVNAATVIPAMHWSRK